MIQCERLRMLRVVGDNKPEHWMGSGGSAQIFLVLELATRKWRRLRSRVVGSLVGRDGIEPRLKNLLPP